MGGEKGRVEGALLAVCQGSASVMASQKQEEQQEQPEKLLAQKVGQVGHCCPCCASPSCGRPTAAAQHPLAVAASQLNSPGCSVSLPKLLCCGIHELGSLASSQLWHGGWPDACMHVPVCLTAPYAK